MTTTTVGWRALERLRRFLSPGSTHPVSWVCTHRKMIDKPVPIQRAYTPPQAEVGHPWSYPEQVRRRLDKNRPEV